jgi:hypothetical protein
MSARFAAVLADLRKEYAKIGEAIEVLEKLDGDHVADPETQAPKTRRGGARKPMAQAASTKPAVNGGDDAPKKHNLQCAKCKTKYIGARKNAACPACHPRNVTAKERYAED